MTVHDVGQKGDLLFSVAGMKLRSDSEEIEKVRGYKLSKPERQPEISEIQVGLQHGHHLAVGVPSDSRD